MFVPRFLFVLLSAVLPVAAEGTLDLLAPTVALYLDFDRTPADGPVAAMQREVKALVEPAGIRIDWRMRGEATGSETYSDLYVLKLRGQCHTDALPVLFSELGPYEETAVVLGAAATVEKEVQSFGLVECDAVRRSIAPRIAGQGMADRDAALGKALGRVLVHELFHMMSKSPHHGRRGLYKASFRNLDLLAERFELDEAEQKELRRIARRLGPQVPR